MRRLGLSGAGKASRCPSACPTCPPPHARSRTPKRWPWRSGSTCRWRRRDDGSDRRRAGPDPGHALRQRARRRLREQERSRRAARERLRDHVRTAAVRLGRRAQRAGRGDVHAVACTAPRDAAVNARSRGARSVLRLPHRLRPGAPLPRRDRAAAQARSPTRTLLRYNGMLSASSNCWPMRASRSPASPPPSRRSATSGSPTPTCRPR